MENKQIFVDTNILIYAHDLDAQEKHKTAKSRIQSLWDQESPPSTSIQVLQEFYVNLVRKNVPSKIARETVMDYLAWDIVSNDEALLVEGMRLKERWDVSLWDALILAAAKFAKAHILWSEDFASGQEYEGIIVVNPLKK